MTESSNSILTAIGNAANLDVFLAMWDDGTNVPQYLTRVPMSRAWTTDITQATFFPTLLMANDAMNKRRLYYRDRIGMTINMTVLQMVVSAVEAVEKPNCTIISHGPGQSNGGGGGNNGNGGGGNGNGGGNGANGGGGRNPNN